MGHCSTVPGMFGRSSTARASSRLAASTAEAVDAITGHGDGVALVDRRAELQELEAADVGLAAAGREDLRQRPLEPVIEDDPAESGPGDEFVNMLANQVRRLPAVPVIGNGQYLLQPVSVHNVAAGFVKALDLNRKALALGWELGARRTRSEVRGQKAEN